MEARLLRRMTAAVLGHGTVFNAGETLLIADTNRSLTCGAGEQHGGRECDACRPHTGVVPAVG